MRNSIINYFVRYFLFHGKQISLKADNFLLFLRDFSTPAYRFFFFSELFFCSHSHIKRELVASCWSLRAMSVDIFISFIFFFFVWKFKRY